MLSIFRRRGSNNSDEETKKKKKKKDGSKTEKEKRQEALRIRYRRWIYDRVDGVPRPPENDYDKPDPYPPSVLCLPPTIIKVCPFLCEENPVCVRMGKCGCCKEEEDWARVAVMRYALFLNLVGVLCLLFTSLSLTSQPDRVKQLLPYVSLAQGELTPTPDNFFEKVVTIQVGLTSILLENPNNNLQVAIRFNQFCDLLGPDSSGTSVPGGLQSFLQAPATETCSNCADAQPRMVIALLVAIFCYVLTILVACTRMYKATDMNCQKSLAFLLQGVTIAGCVYCYYQFTYKCLRGSLLQDDVGYRQNGEVDDADSVFAIVTVNYDWGVGYGMLCLMASFGIKVIDLVCNLCIPAPAIAWNTYDQKMYEGKVNKIRPDAQLTRPSLVKENGVEDEESQFSSTSR